MDLNGTGWGTSAASRDFGPTVVPPSDADTQTRAALNPGMTTPGTGSTTKVRDDDRRPRESCRSDACPSRRTCDPNVRHRRGVDPVRWSDASTKAGDSNVRRERRTNGTGSSVNPCRTELAFDAHDCPVGVRETPGITAAQDRRQSAVNVRCVVLGAGPVATIRQFSHVFVGDGSRRGQACQSTRTWGGGPSGGTPR